jgi:exo-beta-1,3-glucanase (GH17 family)
LALQVIQNENLPLKVMLGNDLKAELNNPNCPWGAIYSEEVLASNRSYNRYGLQRLIELANDYKDIVVAASIGNEASVEWSDHLVPLESLLEFARTLKKAIKQPITFCENYVPWSSQLDPLGEILDVISLHTYPVWEYKDINEALAYTIENYNSVKAKYPNKQVIITEAGWCTKTNGRGMEMHRASEALQVQYIQELLEWSNQQKILTCMFEAFDEPWKGSDDPLEPEKHWGFYYEDRTPKPLINQVYSASLIKT